MRDRLPQFIKMSADREENPPLRAVGCPDYRRCLNEAAYNNYGLDCSRCDAAENADRKPASNRNPRVQKILAAPEFSCIPA
jgi:hypothetical protein